MKRFNPDVLHGILLIALFSLSAFYIAGFEWVKSLSFSPLIVGIILGMIYANTLRNHLPEVWVPGIKFCSKEILRTGVVLYGFRLTFQQVAEIGMPAIVTDLIVVVVTILLGVLLGKLFKIDWQTTLLTATGSAICGAAAVLGAEPVVRAEPHKTAVAVSTVVIFGTLSMFIYPIVYRSGLLDLTNQQWAVYVGGTLHEVAHVVGAGNAIDAAGGNVADAATITKMIRVILLAPALIIMSIILAKSNVFGGAKGEKSKIAVPWFAFGFVGIIALNSLLQEVVPSDFMAQATGVINSFDTFLLTMAMTALGAETSIDKFKQAGAKPFVLAATLYVWLILGGYLLSKLIA
ncbi:MAG: YeiH family putative sulfate export transporter [Marinilabiliaceae bacterium]|nr:YeiH family putative sulfate export transporter [Marinilabiliaceae bacterium]